MKLPTLAMRELLKEHPKKKEIFKAIKRLNQSPTIRQIYELEELLNAPILKYITGDIEYVGPNDNVDVNSARSIYPYINKFFDIDSMIKSSVHNYNFWHYIEEQIVKCTS